MIAYRIVRSKYANDLSGQGAELWGGRWNLVGTPVLYTSSHASLALLEILAWTAMSQLLKASFVLITLDIPDEPIEVIKASDLPDDWYYPENAQITQKLGTDWMIKNDSLILAVPSALLPIEDNLLINPRHPLMEKVKIQNSSELSLDPRLVTNTLADR
ncbi:MAG: RES family NAD+ phosphorylase [Saprospiraceae bacterium]|nr:RES family NAD+ phosphorylase [Saprospiraceae bacterium]